MNSSLRLVQALLPLHFDSCNPSADLEPIKESFIVIQRFLANYLPRHRHPINRSLHVVGVPLSFLVAPILLLLGYQWWVHSGCFVLGYVLQFAGHAVEGNDAGEIVFAKRLLGMPYNEYASSANASSDTECPDDTNPAHQ